jgi:uncharacterized surface protein with fasciclin (FAS1) repeats
MELKLAGLAVAVGLSLAATSCAASSQSGTSQQTRSEARAAAAQARAAAEARAGAGARASQSPSPSAASQEAAAAIRGIPFGADCANLPDVGQGSISSMAEFPVETAVSHNPQLTLFAQVVRAGGLAGALNAATALTVFASDNSAFGQFGTGNMQTLLASKTDLHHLVDYQVVQGTVTPARLATGKPLTSLLGTRIYPDGSAGSYHVDNARVVCGNIRTANATVYIVNQLMIP